MAGFGDGAFGQVAFGGAAAGTGFGDGPFGSVPFGGSASGVSGSAAVTIAAKTLSGSGSTTIPSASGSGSPAMSGHTAAGSGSAGLVGASAASLVAHTAAGSGSTGASGSGALLLQRVTALGLPPVVGTAAVTLNRVDGTGNDRVGTSTGGRAGQTSGARLLTGLAPDVKRSVILDPKTTAAATESSTAWLDWTHNWSVLNSQGNGTLTAKYRERNNVLELQLSFVDGTTTTYSAANQSLDLPSGYTTDTFCTNLPAGFVAVPGRVYWFDDSLEEMVVGFAVPDDTDNTVLNLHWLDDLGPGHGYDLTGTLASQTVPVQFATDDRFMVDLQLPLV